MANMHEIKLRIKGVKQTRQMTKAMELISAVKLKKARQQLELTLPFFEKVRSTMADIVMHSGEIDSIYFDKRPNKKHKKGYIVITSDKGLAGGYNHDVIKLTESLITNEDNYELYVVGHIGRIHFEKNKYRLREDFDYSAQNPDVYRARELMEYFIKKFVKQELDEVYIIYTLMESAIKREPKLLKLLPLERDELLKDLNIDLNENNRNSVSERLIYEPSEKAVFDVLVPKYVKGIIYGALVESFTCEYSERMTAMDNATANADEMLEKFYLYYNRARQASITQEISEIVGGAQVLGKN